MPKSSIDPIVIENLSRVLEESGRSAYSVATALGYAPNGLYQVLKGKNGILLPTLREIAAELGRSVGELVDEPTPADKRDGGHVVGETSPAYNLEAAWDQDGIWNLPIREVSPAAGGGAEVFAEEVVGYVPFRKDWLAQHRIDPAQADVVQVRGDSMEPTLPDGCSILVDRSRQELQPKRIYVLRNEDGLVVKRVDRNRDGWWVVSDNPAWLPVSLTDDTDIIGEVRWTARTL